MSDISTFSQCAASPRLLLTALLLAALPLFAAPPKKAPPPDTWELKFTENFNGKSLDTRLWRRIEGRADAGADWQKNISPRDDLAELKNGILLLKGVRNTDLAADARRVLAGGISSQGLFAMTYGKVEVRARMTGGPGVWPAIWMMPKTSPNGWPHDGEIDILERLNREPFVHQTVHSGWTSSHPNDPPHTRHATVKPEAWNTYALEWTPEAIVWRINGKETHRYVKVNDDRERWPWDKPFYLMLDMQLGGKWVGALDEKALPVVMQVDWVKLYHLKRGGKRLSSFTR